MPKFRKKPVVVEAIKFDGLNMTEIGDFVGKPCKPTLESDLAYQVGKEAPIFSIPIHTLEGTMKAMSGDWIIKGINGEFYPCKPDIFEKTYEPVD